MGIKKKIAKSHAVKETKASVPKRPRGRPRKTVLLTVPAVPTVKRPRGRPRKNPAGAGAKGYRSKFEEIDMSNVRTYKLLGHCPNCKISIGTKDYEKGNKDTVICPSCSTKTKVKKLLPQVIREKPSSKKEYLEQSFVPPNDFHFTAPVHEETFPNEILNNIQAPAEVEDVVLDETPETSDSEDVIDPEKTDL